MDEFSDYQSISQDGTVVYGSDKSAIVRFEEEVILDEEATKQSGFPKYRTIDMIYIRFAGQRDEYARQVLMQDTPTQLADIKRFPRQWEAYKNKTEQVIDGYPITQWAVLTKAQALELKGRGIHTVEQLAGVIDSNLTWMGARQMRDNALAWLEEAEAGTAVAKLTSENSELRLQIEAMQNQINSLANVMKRPENFPVVENNEQVVNIQPVKRMMKKDAKNPPSTGTASG
jgi:hypothetical protein